MLAFILAMSLTVQATAATGNRVGARWDNLLSALTDAEIAVDRIGHCTEELPARRDLEADYQALLDRLVTAIHAARELNPDIDPTIQATVRLMAAGTPHCTASAIRSYATEARRSLAIAEVGLRPDPVSQPQASGLWLGNLQLCGGRVVAVETGEPEFPGAGPGLILRFSADFAPQVHRLTAQYVGRALSVVLDGRVIMSPHVNEPISAAVSIAGPGELPLDRIRAAAMAAC